MKKILLIALILTGVIVSMAQNKKIMVVDLSDPYGCLIAYNNTYNQFLYQYHDDMRDCAYGIAMDWFSFLNDGPDAVSLLATWANPSCAWDAYDRFYTNLDLAADSFVACSGLEITP
ncbi:hypothetical protein D9M68_522350 [compost metagenome]